MDLDGVVAVAEEDHHRGQTRASVETLPGAQEVGQGPGLTVGRGLNLDVILAGRPDNLKDAVLHR